VFTWVSPTQEWMTLPPLGGLRLAIEMTFKRKQRKAWVRTISK